MTVPQARPLVLAALQAPAPRQRHKHMPDEDDENDDDDFSEYEEDDAENNSMTDDMEIPNDGEDHDATIRAGADAAHYTARYAALSEDYEAALDELPENVELVAFPAPALTPERPESMLPPTPTSEIFDKNGKISVALMVKLRMKHQSGTSTRSERIVAIDQKFALGRLLDPTKNFMNIRQAAHHLRVFQALTVGGRQEKTLRELRWQATVKHVQSSVPEKDLPNIASKNVNAVYPLRPGNFVIMRSSTDTSLLYIGEILDLYKYVSRRHGSIDSAAGLSGLSYMSLRVYLPLVVGTSPGVTASTRGLKDGEGTEELDSDADPDDSDDEEPTITHFSCLSKSVDIFTHGFAHELVYHLGPNVMQGTPQVCTLKPWAAARWAILRKLKYLDPNTKPAANTNAKGAKGAKDTPDSQARPAVVADAKSTADTEDAKGTMGVKGTPLEDVRSTAGLDSAGATSMVSAKSTASAKGSASAAAKAKGSARVKSATASAKDTAASAKGAATGAKGAATGAKGATLPRAKPAPRAKAKKAVVKK
ncbi:hypothetical protein VTO73DRAFT_6731 [Trametes versicolor]